MVAFNALYGRANSIKTFTIIKGFLLQANETKLEGWKVKIARSHQLRLSVEQRNEKAFFRSELDCL